MAGFEHSYLELGERFVSEQLPSPVKRPAWLAFNYPLAASLDWPVAWQNSETALTALAGNTLLPGSRPAATAYAGHQFGSYNPRLGDGRAILLGEWINDAGQRYDIQLKGAGRTPFSRGGDGRSPIGPVVREYLVSEAMHALGVPTTRALAAVSSGEPVYREAVEPGAVLTRVASSHLRIGTVQYFAMSKQGDGVAELVDHVAARHYPAALAEAQTPAQPGSSAEVLLANYAPALAALVARWQVLGFVHGVLNTDNMLLSAETVDYGPCAFMDNFDPKACYSAIDTGGRYAWPNQPQIAHWNLSVLAQCLLPLLASDEAVALAKAQSIVDQFPAHYFAAHSALLCAKFGLTQWRESDTALVDTFYQALADENLDHTLAFRWLTEVACDTLDHSPLPELFVPGAKLEAWLNDWQQRRALDSGDITTVNAIMRNSNPCVIPRNHQVAEAIAAATAGDNSAMQRYGDRWQTPWEWQDEDLELARPPVAEERVFRTFCGT